MKITIEIEALPGEAIQDCYAYAKRVLGYHNALVTIIHNNKKIVVERGDTLVTVMNKYNLIH